MLRVQLTIRVIRRAQTFSGVFFFTGNLKSLNTVGEKIPAVIVIKLILKTIHLGQYVGKVAVFLLKTLSVLSYAILCYAMLCYAMLCYAMLCCAMLCCSVLCY